MVAECSFLHCENLLCTHTHTKKERSTTNSSGVTAGYLLPLVFAEKKYKCLC